MKKLSLEQKEFESPFQRIKAESSFGDLFDSRSQTSGLPVGHFTTASIYPHVGQKVSMNDLSKENRVAKDL
jgi:hypothetical protein